MDGCVVARGVFDAVKRDEVSVEPRPVAPLDASGLPEGGVGRGQHLALTAVPQCFEDSTASAAVLQRGREPTSPENPRSFPHGIPGCDMLHGGDTTILDCHNTTPGPRQ